MYTTDVTWWRWSSGHPVMPSLLLWSQSQLSVVGDTSHQSHQHRTFQTLDLNESGELFDLQKASLKMADACIYFLMNDKW